MRNMKGQEEGREEQSLNTSEPHLRQGFVLRAGFSCAGPFPPCLPRPGPRLAPGVSSLLWAQRSTGKRNRPQMRGSPLCSWCYTKHQPCVLNPNKGQTYLQLALSWLLSLCKGGPGGEHWICLCGGDVCSLSTSQHKMECRQSGLQVPDLSPRPWAAELPHCK